MNNDQLADDGVSNPTDNRPFHDVLATRISRRGAVAGGAATLAAAFLGTAGPAGATSPVAAFDRDDDRRGGRGDGYGPGNDDIDFEPVPNDQTTGPEPTISSDYTYDVLIPWGEPLQPNGPEFSWPQTSAEDQENQIGIGHDGMWYFESGSRNGILCINHEFGRTPHVLGKDEPESLEEVRIMQAAHGVSVVKIRRRGNGNWERTRSNKNRRITVNTPVEFSGPVAGSSLLETKAGNAPAGTVNNCANGYTPWGTYLTCEENFNGYFGATGAWTATPAQERYGFSEEGFGYAWHKFDERFDLSDEAYANEENRFGWIVEIDPDDPKAAPIKRTAMGRVKHEGCALTVGRGNRVVGYMGDDERFDYIYKFVSSDDYHEMRKQGVSPLDDGKLYVARFNDDGTGDWLELTIDDPALASIFSSQAEVLTYARLAADALGATPMDRPEWTTVGPGGEVFCTLTNNTRREAPNAANPIVNNEYGHIIKWTDSDYHVGSRFLWDIIIEARTTAGTDYAFGSPDGLWADPDGRVFIQTDGDQPEGATNNQMLVTNTDGVVKRLLSGVTDDEITGIAVTSDRKTMFVNLQHPGNGDPALTNFPAPTDGKTVPRDVTLAIRRKDGGIVGS